jgi:hypothetical protein
VRLSSRGRLSAVDCLLRRLLNLANIFKFVGYNLNISIIEHQYSLINITLLIPLWDGEYLPCIPLDEICSISTGDPAYPNRISPDA